eukprot:CAMPEP_0198140780 /NCGR_PEP_ID=MMETSP1443-20131203/3884_1 /TAXON_ID=186043 /ORGANISM="Entomoneis sp., Strain CCMP2396" /LENGTH=416 /DNA_ID=CAMNT_0043803309 /DNA_START=24 /DNA_END=1270 /DNA_ORIENTATION=+
MSFRPHPFPVAPHFPPAKAMIKLALEGPQAEKDGPFVRVQLPDDVGPQSLELLRKRALDLWQATNGSDLNLADAKVFLTYRDNENDLCFIFSEDDLRCALPLFPSALRVFARVEFAGKKQPVAAVAVTPEVVPIVTSEGTKTAQTTSFADIPVHKVVEAVVGVLAAANLALQKHVKISRTQGTSTGEEPVVSDSAATVPATNTEPDVVEERLFIHGRHTCDGCLTTPVVGTRFHAVNMPDYDLCAGCRSNYKGDEIKFEEAELDRDLPMQERWYRRFNKWSQKNQRQAERQSKKEERIARRCGPPGRGPPARGPPGHGPPNHLPPPFAPPPHHHHHGVPPCQRQWNKHPRFFGAPPETCGPPPEHVDQALKEAIRRSMQDLRGNRNKEEEDKEKVEKDVEQPAVVEVEDVEQPAAV